TQSTADGVLMSEAEIVQWILNRSNKFRQSRQRRCNFDDSKDVSIDDYPLLAGVTKSQFDLILQCIQPGLHTSVNRTPRQALAILLMLIRHDLSQRILAALSGMKYASISSYGFILCPRFQQLCIEDALKQHSRKIYNLFKASAQTLFLVLD